MNPFSRVRQPARRVWHCQRRAASRVVLSGIQPTGIPHLGNYLGALSNWVKLQQSAQRDDVLLFSIVGWHALTLPQDPALLRLARDDMLAALVAIGIDPTRSILFHQDQNRHHTELGWILNCITPIGKLRRMTTWKSRLAASKNAGSESGVDESQLNAGLFTYPVLQAADVLIYRATHVPVGEDQRQHIELTRDLAEIFNRTFSRDQAPLFALPEYVDTLSKRILSLKDPTSKMSKSSPDTMSRILLTDSAAQIKAKIRGAVTDTIRGVTYDPVSRPGTSNLLTILAACTDGNVLDIAARYETKGHADLKRDVTDAVEEVLRGPRAEFEKIRHDKGFLDEVAQKGLSRAMAYSAATIERCLSKALIRMVPRALSKGQERKAVEFLEYSFQDVESSFKKRSEPSLTKLPTLTAYLDAMHHLLAFILQIPPIDPSTALRVAFLLRLTNDVMNSVPGYPPEIDDLRQLLDFLDDLDDLRQLLDFLDDLDEAWLAVLNSQVWDPSSGAGVDLLVPVDMIEPDKPIRSTPVSQTERTRLHSLLITGTAGLEEWLSKLATPADEDYQLVLERAGLLQGFDDLFSKTLAEMGSLSEPLIDPAGSMGTC